MKCVCLVASSVFLTALLVVKCEFFNAGGSVKDRIGTTLRCPRV